LTDLLFVSGDCDDKALIWKAKYMNDAEIKEAEEIM
jgi:hypothetical protein